MQDTRVWEVYRLRNSANGKLYIGITSAGSEERLKQHLAAAARGYGNCRRLNGAIRKHGPGSFELDVLASALSQEDAETTERALIAEFGTVSPAGYNLTHGGSVGALSKESSAKRSASMRGKSRPDIRERRLGVAHSEETKAKIGAAHKGRKKRPESVAALRAALIGYKHSDETRANMSASRMGKSRGPYKPRTEGLSAQTRVRMSEAQLARWQAARGNKA